MSLSMTWHFEKNVCKSEISLISLARICVMAFNSTVSAVAQPQKSFYDYRNILCICREKQECFSYFMRVYGFSFHFHFLLTLQPKKATLLEKITRRRIRLSLIGKDLENPAGPRAVLEVMVVDVEAITKQVTKGTKRGSGGRGGGRGSSRNGYGGAALGVQRLQVERQVLQRRTWRWR